MALWDRQRGEPPVAFEAFCVYRDLLSERTLQRAYEKRSGRKGKHGRYFATLSSQWKWVERAAAYDEYLDFIRKTSTENAMRDAGNEIARARVDHKRGEAALARRMITKAMKILSSPMVREKTLDSTETTDDGKTIINRYTIKKPVRYSLNSAAILALAASKLGRVALDIGDDETDITPEDFSKNFFKTNEELADALPEGVVPEIPADPSAPPVLKLPEQNSDLTNAKVDRAPPMRPGNNGNGDQ